MKLLIITLSLVALSTCYLGADVSQLFPSSSYTCLKNAGYHFVVPRGYCSFGGVDHNVINSLNNIRAAGLITDVYL